MSTEARRSAGRTCASRGWAALKARICGALGAGDAAVGAAPAGGISGDVGELARRVIAGGFGNGEERKRRLGMNYAAVQRRVNEMLS